MNRCMKDKGIVPLFLGGSIIGVRSGSGLGPGNHLPMFSRVKIALCLVGSPDLIHSFKGPKALGSLSPVRPRFSLG